MALQFAIGLGLAVAGAVIGTLIWESGRRYWQRRRDQGPLNSLLGFHSGTPVLVIYPPRDPAVENRILPNISTEDFLAINNVQRALATAGWQTDEIQFRDDHHVEYADRQKNLVLICLRNAVAVELLAELTKTRRLDARFEQLQDGTTELVCQGGHWPSKTFQQENALRKAGKHEVALGPLDDVALLVKVRNPWNPRTSVLLIAGARGIGTWGAASHLRKRPRDLLERKSAIRPKSKDGDYVAIVSVKYSKYDIVDSTVEHFAELP